MKNKILIAFALILCYHMFSAQATGPYFVGLNWWLPNALNPSTAPGVLAGDIKNSGPKTMRFGGTAANHYNYHVFNPGWNELTNPNAGNQLDLINAVLACRNNGIIPIVQVPTGEPSSPYVYNSTHAIQIMNWLNQNGPGSGTPFTYYWAVGNEPNLINWNPVDVKNYHKDIAIELRRNHANSAWSQFPCLIIGPTLNWADPCYYKPLLGQTNCSWPNCDLLDVNTASNIDPNFKAPCIDYFSFNNYPFVDEGALPNTGSCPLPPSPAAANFWPKPSLSNVINSHLFQDIPNQGPQPCSGSQRVLRNVIDDLRGVAAANNHPTQPEPNLKLAITEANICFKNDINNSQPSSGGTSKAGNSANGYVAGQFWAEMMATAREKEIGLLNFWSVREGGSTSPETNVGYIDNSTGDKRSTYYHFKMYAPNFTGKFHPCVLTGGTTSYDGVKIFGSQNACGKSYVMVMNQNTISRQFAFTLGTIAPSSALYGTYPVQRKLNFEAISSQVATMDDIIPGRETWLYTFDQCGYKIALQKYPYNNYSLNLPPNSPQTWVNPNAANCICNNLATVIGNSGNSMKMCPDANDNGSGHFNDRTLSTSTTITGETFITGELTIAPGAVVTIDEASVTMGHGSKITVLDGGKLFIVGSNFDGCMSGTWEGITINGSHGSSNPPFSISSSTIQYAEYPLVLKTVDGAIIESNVFYSGKNALTFDDCGRFNIQLNEIGEFKSGLRTSNAVGTNSTLKQNIFYGMDTAFYSVSDHFDSLEIRCNSFNYKYFGMYFSGSLLKDQGSSDEGAGNRFLTDADLTNNQLWYDGTSMTYYTDPSNSFTLVTGGGQNATSVDASADAGCPDASPRSALSNSVDEAETDVLPKLACSPNPATERVTFDFFIPLNERGELKVTDLLGVKMSSYRVSATDHQRILDVTQWQPGLYLYYIELEGKKTASGKLIISR